MALFCDHMVRHLHRSLYVNRIANGQKDRLDIDVGAQNPSIALTVDLNIGVCPLHVGWHHKIRPRNPVVAFGDPHCRFLYQNTRVCCQPHMPWMQIAIAVKKEDIRQDGDFLVCLQKEWDFPKSQTSRYVWYVDDVRMAHRLKYCFGIVVDHHNTADGVLLSVLFFPVRQIDPRHGMNLRENDRVV